ncbi:conserved protein of unknown function [Georgfuchsia toluolica]|uniref:Replication-associated protein ORF2/G2P domain-containing protein n=1 Tax=Georgfuchsia toluolica TaxID=424218 RepID=A0A916J6Z0_9PROT|nr:hypothetical protein [Georgfuchsia toluolica]CAG4885094.1 conserved protein of unknown function [Georgfuchsia toluolica]
MSGETGEKFVQPIIYKKSPYVDYSAPWIPPVLRDYFHGTAECEAPLPAARAQRGAGSAQRAPLDLIKEHLTDEPTYKPCEVAGKLLEGWQISSHWAPPPDGELSAVLKIQSFQPGGYEATVRFMDLARISRAIEFGGKRGKREVPEEVDPENVLKATARAKRKVRYLVKNMAASHLATFTRRESEPDEYWTAEDWAKAWDRLKRGIERVLGPFPYVGILERHEKGNFHLHVAWCGRINLNVIRPLWWHICGGRGMGNVDAKYIKVREGLERSDRVARYISKYVSKMFEETGRFNKKRYWASRQTLDDVRRYVLSARDLSDALVEVKRFLGLDWSKFIHAEVRNRKVVGIMKHMFHFPDGSGLWFSFIPELHGGTPPPF